jgi:hypothetical protein
LANSQRVSAVTANPVFQDFVVPNRPKRWDYSGWPTIRELRRGTNRGRSNQVVMVLFGTGSIHFLDIRQRPAPIEVRFQRCIESETYEPRLAWHGLNPVFLKALRRGRAEVNIHRVVSISREIFPRPKLGAILLVKDN